ncbi:MAG: hypothetical protein EAZ79_22025 [Oscillatoriales cyanobacterium]|nr:MAG: hypothetical protein EAZ79_22025 [Oscillatoriales cyanobacterium]
MAIQYTVNAEVVDIGSDIPQKDDIFLVDTNVWYWLTYTPASTSARSYQINDYPAYLTKILSAQGLLLYCGLSLAELAHNIEQAERAIFSTTLKPKEYRHNEPTERANVVAEVIALILEAMDKAGVVQVITDDGDYVTVPGIKVFTANHNVITAARNQGKLITR